MIPVLKAASIVERACIPLGTERIALPDSINRVLAEDVVADTDLPPFDRAQMDGYALRARDTRKVPVDLVVVGESAAGSGWHHRLKAGEAVRIMTGAPVPSGADTVQKVELTKELNGLVSLIDPVPKKQNIVRKGTEIRKGEVVLRSGALITPEMIATPAAFGYARLRVARRPRVTIIPTGSEIVPFGRKPKRDQIRDSNSVMLKAFCDRAGAASTVLQNVGDELEGLTRTIRAALLNSDIVVTTGGVSVGKYDLTKAAFKKVGARLLFEKVAVKPGKPAVFAVRGKKLLFGLPGNPVSAAVTFHLFVRRAILALQSAGPAPPDRGFAVLNSPLKGNRLRDTYLAATFASSADGKLIAVPLPSAGSADLVAFARAEALIVVPKAMTFAAGDVVEVEFL
ncbi:MAG: molybdopterin molybdotransferase MoeA [Chloracidobacterium sp.]|nr:molybdopterin molybdotransferase MoeA [Chloracidobacterium sp.]